MPKPFDAASKALTDRDPQPWVELSGHHPKGKLRILNVDISTVTSASDYAVGVYTTRAGREILSWIAHLEFSSAHDNDLIRECAARNALIHRKYKVGVLTILILLEKDAYRAASMTGTYETWADGKLTSVMNYEIVKIWEYSVEDLLNMEPQLMALAVFSHEVQTRDHVESVLDRLHQKLVDKLGEDWEQIKIYWTAAEVLLGVKFKKDEDKVWVKTCTRRVLQVRDSVIYQDILSEGRAEGRTEGQAEGRLLERLEMLIKLGTVVMGPPSKDERAKLKTISDLRRLGRMVNRVSPNSTWSSLLDQT